MRTVLLAVVMAVSLQAEPPKSPLAGEWSIVRVEGDGLAKALKESVSSIQIDDEKITAGRAAEYTWDAKANTIDMTMNGGPKEEQGKYLGVYEVKGNELTLHFALPGKERPKGFTAKDGSFVIALKKR